MKKKKIRKCHTCSVILVKGVNWDRYNLYCKKHFSEYSREYFRRYSQTEEYKEKRRRLISKGVLTRYDRGYRQRFPEKKKARNKFQYLVRKGKIAHLACEYCGNFLSEAHHYNGYDGDNWKEVWWLCSRHHIMADRGELVLYPPTA